MTIIELVICILFAAVFALFAIWRVERLDLQLGIAAFLFALYCGFVALRTSGKKREITLWVQTAPGVVTTLAIAAVFSVPASGYMAAPVIGVAVGYTADLWVKHVQLP